MQQCSHNSHVISHNPSVMHFSANQPVTPSVLQEIFPAYFGPKYDAALEMLVWEFISRMEELLPVPDFTQVV